MPRLTHSWRLLLALTLCASLAVLGTVAVTPAAHAGFYDTTLPGQGGGGGGAGDPTAAGDPDVPTGSSGKDVRTDGVISSTVNLESGSAVAATSHLEWTKRLTIVLLSLRAYLLRF